MKLSFYNHYVKTEGVVLIYNAANDTYIAISQSNYNYLIENKDNLQLVQLNKQKLYNTLVDIGVIIDDSINEKELAKNAFLKRKFAQNRYEITINPTMDCNLKCWYCYEDHIENQEYHMKQ